MWRWSDALLVDVYMQGELAVTYKVRDAIPLVLTEQPACHEKAGALRWKKAMARQALGKLARNLFGRWWRRLGGASGIVGTASHVVGF